MNETERLEALALVNNKLAAMQRELGSLAAELAASERLKEQILQTLPALVLIYDARVSGVTRMTALPCPLGICDEELAHWLRHPPGAEPIARRLIRLRAGDRLVTRSELVLADGEKRWLELREAYFPDEGRDRVLSTLLDITGAHRAEEVREDHVHFITHELRNPIATIDGYAQLAAAHLGPDGDPILRRAVEGIGVQAARMETLVGRILVSASVDAAGPDTPSALSCAEVIADAIDQLPASATHRVRVRGGCDAAILADPWALAHVLGNVLTNALKYSADDKRVDLVCARTGDDVTFEVRDRGPGIPPDQAELIFGRYVRGDHAFGEGFGLGLYVSRQIVESYGGSIDVRVRRGGGSVFRVTLPLAEDDAAIA